MRIVAIQLVLFVMFQDVVARAADTPGLAKWLAQKGIDSAIASAQTGLLVVERATHDAKPQPAGPEQAQLGLHVWHYVIGERATDLTAVMNGGKDSLAEKLPPSLESLSKLFFESVVWQRNPKNCRLWVGHEVSVDPAECSGRDGKSIAFALRRVLGFNAVVVAQRGRFLLVEGPSAAVAFGGQGLLYQNSSKKTLLSPDDRKGGAMVQLVEGSGRFGVYETFLDKSAAAAKVPKGSKILLDDP